MEDAVGRRRITNDPIDPARASVLAKLLGLTPPETGTPLPYFFHQAYFWEAVSPDQIGRDGHVARGPFLPDLGLPRRMWAGGRLTFHRPLLAGVAARKESTIERIAKKNGHTGSLAFITIRHEITQNSELCTVEEQDLVFREEHRANSPSPRIRKASEDAAPVDHRFDPAFLFRYSAITYNGHRIHYDVKYAKRVEGYGGLVVHGPLLAQLMMLRAARDGPLSSFEFRAVRPLLVTETATICRNDERLWVRNETGALNMEAEAAWR